MQILIWKAYGEIDVYCAETAKQLESILSDVIDCVKYVTSPEDIPIIEEFKQKIEFSIETKKLAAARCFMRDLVEEFNMVGSHESFEYFYFDKVKYG